MIVMHGLGDSMKGYYWLPEELKIHWLNYMLLNAPDKYYDGYSWFDFNENAENSILRSVQLVSEVIDFARRRLGFDSENIFLFGFSQGCTMTIETGLRYPSRLAGLIGISGFLINPNRLLNDLSEVAFSQRLLITHGKADSLLPFEEVKKQIQLLKQNGINIEWHELEKDHTIDSQIELQLIRDFITKNCNQKNA
jgi:phospholipase/carboxylesterase